MGWDRDGQQRGFNPRARKGRDTTMNCTFTACRFQSTRPQGARRGQGGIQARLARFQSTRPQGARLAPPLQDFIPACFNPRARKGRDIAPLALFVADAVSIHAPARGATTASNASKPINSFNPRARKGRDRESMRVRRRRHSFNPRARKGRDVVAAHLHAKRVVSIHAPARGATLCGCRTITVEVVSIHAPARGATRGHCQWSARDVVSIHAPARGATAGYFTGRKVVMFQSTRPQGARPRYFRRCAVKSCCFNPRARKGRDCQLVPLPEVSVQVSIHAPARGATRAHRLDNDDCGVSIHAPARGATRRMTGWRLMIEVSIHAPARGATSFAAVLSNR